MIEQVGNLLKIHPVTPKGREAQRAIRHVSTTEWAAYAILVIMFLGLAGRVLDYPLNRDENLYITVARLSGRSNLYRDLGYNHLPYFPWLLGQIYRVTGTEHFLLTGRLLTLGGWASSLVGLWLIARQTRAGFLAFFTAASLLMGNVLLLGAPGMLVSNNLLPLPLAIFAIYALIRGLSETRPSAPACFLAGVLVSCAIGLKANYIFLAPFMALATVLAPVNRPLQRRLLIGSLPLAAGGFIAGLPVLTIALFDAHSFFAHTVRYFTELQTAYWAQSSDPKVASIPEKVLFAESIWAANANLLAMTGIVALTALPIARRNLHEAAELLFAWPVLLVLALAAIGFVVAFVPAPSFPQYFVPPIPFLLIAVIVLRSRIGTVDRVGADAVLLALAVLALTCSVSRIVPGLSQLARPTRWETLALDRDMRELAGTAGFRGGERAATLSPVFALAGGLTVPDEFAAGQFVYRVAEHIPPKDRPYYTTTSPRDLKRFLDADPPEAVLVNGSEKLEKPFLDYARARGYAEFKRERDGATIFLFRRQGGN